MFMISSRNEDMNDFNIHELAARKSQDDQRLPSLGCPIETGQNPRHGVDLEMCRVRRVQTEWTIYTQSNL